MPEVRIGVVVPNGDLVHEREFLRLRPDGVSFRFASFSYPAMGNANFCGNLGAEMSAPIAELNDWGAKVVLIGCTTASMTCASPEWQAELERMAKVRVVTAAEASIQAISALGARSIAVATPYGDAGNRTVTTFLLGKGFAVASIKGLGLDRSVETWRKAAPCLSIAEMLGFSLSVDSENAQAIYLPCTGVGSLEVLDELEKSTRKPAISSVQAGFWASLRLLGINGRAKGFGRLIDVWDF